MSRWRLEVGEQGRAVVRVTGRTSARDAPGILDTARSARREGHPTVVLDLSHASGSIDLLVASLQETLVADPTCPAVELIGLNQHYQRLLDYLGVTGAFAAGRSM